MSMIGTGPAAGVAQVALQAQQVARQRDSRQAQSSAAAARLRDQVDDHLSVLDEADEETPEQLSINSHLPRRQPEEEPARDDGRPPDADDAAASDDTSADGTNGAAPSQDDEGLYHHLDVRA
jgi:hypothetical protein